MLPPADDAELDGVVAAKDLGKYLDQPLLRGPVSLDRDDGLPCLLLRHRTVPGRRRRSLLLQLVAA